MGLIFTYLMTCGGAVLALFNPFYGLLVLICFDLIKPPHMWFWSVQPGNNYSRFVAIALLVGWLFRGFGRWDLGRAWPIVSALLAYLVWVAIGTALAPESDVALQYLEEQTKIVLPFLVGITTIASIRQLKQVAWVITLSEGYVALEMNRSYYAGFNRVYEIGFGSMDNNCVAISMVTCTALAFFLGMKSPRWWQKGLALVSAALMMHTTIIARSRGGMVALLFAFLVGFYLMPKSPKHYLAFALAVLVGIRLAWGVSDRIETMFQGSSTALDETGGHRLTLWGNCLDAMMRQPLFGVGPNHWGLIVTRYGWPEGKLGHSLWLQDGAELGIPALIFLLLFYLLCIIRLWPIARGRRQVSDPWIRDCACMVIAALIGFIIATQFVSLHGLETPFHIVMIGNLAIKFADMPSASCDPVATDPGATPYVLECPH